MTKFVILLHLFMQYYLISQNKNNNSMKFNLFTYRPMINVLNRSFKVIILHPDNLMNKNSDIRNESLGIFL